MPETSRSLDYISPIRPAAEAITDFAAREASPPAYQPLPEKIDEAITAPPTRGSRPANTLNPTEGTSNRVGVPTLEKPPAPPLPVAPSKTTGPQQSVQPAQPAAPTEAHSKTESPASSERTERGATASQAAPGPLKPAPDERTPAPPQQSKETALPDGKTAEEDASPEPAGAPPHGGPPKPPAGDRPVPAAPDPEPEGHDEGSDNERLPEALDTNSVHTTEAAGEESDAAPTRPNRFIPTNLKYPQPAAEIFDRWREHGDHDAALQIIGAYKDFIGSIVGGYAASVRAGRGVTTTEDLTQQAIAATLRSAQLFNPDRGVRFLTVAYENIRGAVYQAYSDASGASRVPRNNAPQHDILRQEQGRRKAAGAPPLTVREIADLLNLEVGHNGIAMELRENRTALNIDLAERVWAAGSLEDIVQAADAPEETGVNINPNDSPMEALDAIADARLISTDVLPIDPEEALLQAEHSRLLRTALIEFLNAAGGNTEEEVRVHRENRAILIRRYNLDPDAPPFNLTEYAAEIGIAAAVLQRRLDRARGSLRRFVRRNPKYRVLLPGDKPR